MAYKDVDAIYEQALAAIFAYDLVFIEDVISMLPLTKPTFYTYFPVGSERMEMIKNELAKNTVVLKASMRNKWYESDAPALQLALMKLLSSPEELKKLAMNYHDVDHKNAGKSFKTEKTTIVFKKKT